MPSSRVETIQDEELRGLMAQADKLLDEGTYAACVRVCADAYLKLLKKHPRVRTVLTAVLSTERIKTGLDTGTLRFAPLMWPRLAAKLHLPEDGEPTITFDRDFVSFAETIQYYEFTANLITDAEKGTLNMKPVGGDF